MSIIVIYMIISFLLDGLVSNYTSINIANPSYFRTIFSIVALTISYSYFEYDKKYLYIAIFLGIAFDIVYTNTLLLNVFIFLILYLAIKKITLSITDNIITINIKTIIIISFYHLMSYTILTLANYLTYSYKLLILIIIRSIIMTIIYTTISYYIINKIYYAKHTKKIK